VPDVITACVILHNVLRKQANEDLKALGSMVDNGGPEDNDDNAYSVMEVNDLCDDGVPQSRTTNNEEDLRCSLACYLRSQRGVGP
jgi:hypothetical protein